MKIEQTRPPPPWERRRVTATKAAFSDFTAASVKDVAGLTGLAAPGPVVLTQFLESVDPDAQKQRRRALAYGRDLLDRLDQLCVAMLDGDLDARQLKAILQQVAAETPSTSDPSLSRAIAEIELRVSVEMAKLGAFPNIEK